MKRTTTGVVQKTLVYRLDPVNKKNEENLWHTMDACRFYVNKLIEKNNKLRERFTKCRYKKTPEKCRCGKIKDCKYKLPLNQQAKGYSAIITKMFNEEETKGLGEHWRKKRGIRGEVSDLILRNNLDCVFDQNKKFVKNPKDAGIMKFKSVVTSPLSFSVPNTHCEFDGHRVWIAKICNKKDRNDWMVMYGENKKYPNAKSRSCVVRYDRAKDVWYLHISFEVKKKDSGNIKGNAKKKVIGD